MKGFITAIVIFSSLIALLFYYNIHITATVSSLINYAVAIENSLEEENYDKALKLSDSFDKKLRKEAKYLYKFTDRTPIDSSITECARMKSFIKLSDAAEAASSLSGIKVTLEKTLEKSVLFPIRKKEV